MRGQSDNQGVKKQQRREASQLVTLSKVQQKHPGLFDQHKITAVDKMISLIDILPARFRNIQTLYLSKNCLKEVSGIEQFVNLRTVSLVDNLLNDFEGIVDLQKLCCLSSVSLSGNRLALLPAYRSRCLLYLPQIHLLDSKKITEQERQDALLQTKQLATMLALMTSNYCLIHKLGMVLKICGVHVDLLQQRWGGVGRQAEAPDFVLPNIFKMVQYWDFEALLHLNEKKSIVSELERKISGCFYKRVTSKQDEGDGWKYAMSQVLMSQQQIIAQFLHSIEHLLSKSRVYSYKQTNSSFQNTAAQLDFLLPHRENAIAEFGKLIWGIYNNKLQSDVNNKQKEAEEEEETITLACPQKSVAPVALPSDKQIKVEVLQHGHSTLLKEEIPTIQKQDEEKEGEGGEAFQLCQKEEQVRKLQLQLYYVTSQIKEKQEEVKILKSKSSFEQAQSVELKSELEKRHKLYNELHGNFYNLQQKNVELQHSVQDLQVQLQHEGQHYAMAARHLQQEQFKFQQIMEDAQQHRSQVQFQDDVECMFQKNLCRRILKKFQSNVQDCKQVEVIKNQVEQSCRTKLIRFAFFLYRDKIKQKILLQKLSERKKRRILLISLSYWKAYIAESLNMHCLQYKAELISQLQLVRRIFCVWKKQVYISNQIAEYFNVIHTQIADRHYLLTLKERCFSQFLEWYIAQVVPRRKAEKQRQMKVMVTTLFVWKVFLTSKQNKRSILIQTHLHRQLTLLQSAFKSWACIVVQKTWNMQATRTCQNYSRANIIKFWKKQMHATRLRKLEFSKSVKFHENYLLCQYSMKWRSFVSYANQKQISLNMSCRHYEQWLVRKAIVGWKKWCLQKIFLMRLLSKARKQCAVRKLRAVFIAWCSSFRSLDQTRSLKIQIWRQFMTKIKLLKILHWWSRGQIGYNVATLRNILYDAKIVLDSVLSCANNVEDTQQLETKQLLASVFRKVQQLQGEYEDIKHRLHNQQQQNVELQKCCKQQQQQLAQIEEENVRLHEQLSKSVQEQLSAKAVHVVEEVSTSSALAELVIRRGEVRNLECQLQKLQNKCHLQEKQISQFHHQSYQVKPLQEKNTLFQSANKRSAAQSQQKL